MPDTIYMLYYAEYDPDKDRFVNARPFEGIAYKNPEDAVKRMKEFVRQQTFYINSFKLIEAKYPEYWKGTRLIYEYCGKNHRLEIWPIFVH